MSKPTRVGLLAIQGVVASASPSAWRDAIVTAIDDGELELSRLDGTLMRIWSTASVGVGEPVAIHPVAEVVAVGDRWYAARAA